MERLDSWKEIAEYLGRDIKTVQRWEKREGLPIHRHQHEHRGSVYAHPTELQTWWTDRRRGLTPEASPVHVPTRAPSRNDRARSKLLPAALVFAVAAVSAALLVASIRGTPELSARAASLAVLPLQPSLADSRDESLELGLTDGLIAKLSEIGQLRVRSLESVRSYVGSSQDPRITARDLAVDALLLGSLQRVGDRIHLSVRLIDGGTRQVLWAETFDEQWTDIFSVQDAIAAQVSRALQLRLSAVDQERLARHDTENAAAYREYLIGRQYWSQFTAAAVKQALPQFERAVALDPNYALAHAAIADAYTSFATYRILSPREAYPKARTAAEQALRLDPELSEAHSALGLVHLYHDWDWGAAERSFRHAIATKPENAEAHNRYALALAWFERFDEALDQIRQAREADPLLRRINVSASQILYHARRYDQALVEVSNGLKLDPNFFQNHQQLGWIYVQTRDYDAAIAAFKRALDLGAGAQVEADLAHAYAMAGQTAAARELLGRLIERSTRVYIAPFDIAVVYAGLRDRDEAFAWLEKAYDERARPMLGLKVNPRLEPLRGDARFEALMQRVGMWR